MDAKNAQLQSAGLKQETDLKKHISDLKGKLDSATHGRRAESEMYEESMAKTQRLETIMNELNAKVTLFYHKNFSHDKSALRLIILFNSQKNNSNVSKFKIKIFEDENLELRDQLSAALENQTTKSIGSFGSDDFSPNDHHHHHEKVCEIV